MSLADCRVDWDGAASLKERVPPEGSFGWVGDPIYDGTIAGALRAFKKLPHERQLRTDMFVDRARIQDISTAILEFDALTILANRPDLPVD